MDNILQIKHNEVCILDINAFVNIRSKFNNGCKDVHFVRAIGGGSTYVNDVKGLDESLLSQMNDGEIFYSRINNLPKMPTPEDVELYVKCYSDWILCGRKEVYTKVTKDNIKLAHALSAACAKVEEIYVSKNRQLSDSMIKNFVVKLLFWSDELFRKENMGNKNFVWEENKTFKIVAANVEKIQEYLFYYMLTLIGCDVLLLQGSKDIGAEEEVLGLSQKFVAGPFLDVVLPEYKWHETGKPRLVIPPRNRPSSVRTVSQKDIVVSQVNTINSTDSTNSTNVSLAEKSFEELALLASSIVMIAIHDEKGEVIGSGSGIMIGRQGYILTNNHVTAGGRSYSVRIEDDNNVYETTEMIKYNQFLDLAIIRIDRRLDPIKVYNGTKKLVRGQKVVAIGSPLGLFNSVSDGIISGFRQIDMVDMIQFTAPTSHGSSGGAVLNMQGEVIGISTAGYSAGQNINLAVGYEAINQFIRGFT